MLDKAPDASVHLDAGQRTTLRTALASRLPALQRAGLAQARLSLVLSDAQIEYLNSHRGPLVFKGKTVEGAGIPQVRTVIDEISATASSSPLPSTQGRRASLAVDLDELVTAPLRLAGDPAVALSKAQLDAFRSAFTLMEQAREIEGALAAAIDQALRPEQKRYIESLGPRMEVLRHTLVLTLLGKRVSPLEGR